MGQATNGYDYVVIGSGFGGSVSALRLAEKGYKVCVLEAGRRWAADDFPKSNWRVGRFLWMPKLGCYGIQAMTLLDDVLVLHGAGVGGGSLVYANTLLVPPDEAFAGTGWPDDRDWRAALDPHYEIAARMLGRNEVPRDFPADELLKRAADKIGRGDTFRRQQVAVFFGEPDKTVPDPYFDGKGPDRTGCNFCGGCMVGCRFGAKNTLDKNYLYLAEQLGVEVVPMTRAEMIRALPEGGYAVDTTHSGDRVFKKTRSFFADNVVVSAGALGTVELLLKCREAGGLPNLSDCLGTRVRTNSESIIGSAARNKDVDYSKGVAIGSSVHIDDETHVEAVRYSSGSDAMGLLRTLMVDGGGRMPRALRWLGNVTRHPIDAVRATIPFGFARQTVILLVMQALESSLQLKLRRRWWWPFSKTLSSAITAGEPSVPTWIPGANDFARVVADIQDGVPGSSINEAILDVPITAHILGGCPMALDSETGVIDSRNEAFGHPGLYVVDGSAVPSNLGVNPSLTITALAEHAMSQIEPDATVDPEAA